MDPQRISARWAYVLVTSLALAAGCGDSSTGAVDDGDEDNGGSSSGKTPANNNGNNSSTSPTEPGGETQDQADGGSQPTTPGQDLGQGDGKDVITMGDSYMHVGGLTGPGPDGTEVSLEKISKRTYRKYGNTGGSAITAVSVLNNVIPGQFDKAKKDNANIKTVVIAAGGNDLGDQKACQGPKTEAEVSADCKKKINEVEAAIEKMVATMAKAGVKDILWVGYGPIKTSKAEMTGTMAYLNTVRKSKCVANDPARGLRCHIVVLMADLVGKIGSDGAHPTAAGFDAIGKNVWARMQQEGTRR
jgi:hypothetical protein